MKRALKILGWTLLSVVVIVIMAITLVVWYLTPAKLTPIVQREATALVDGEVNVSKVELTFWSSFPRVRLDIDSLEVISHSMHSLPDSMQAKLPVYTDSLFSIAHMHGAINLLSALKGDIELYDITIINPRGNIVTGPDGITNVSIFKTSETADTVTPSSSQLPDITFDRFKLVDAGPVTFTSLTDSTFISATLGNVNLDGESHPAYTLTLEGNASSPLLDEFNLSPLTIGLDGCMTWSPQRPAAIDISKLNLSINELDILADCAVDATDRIVIERLSLLVDKISIHDIVNHLPADMRSGLDGLDTDMRLTAGLKLLEPYTVTDSMTIPVIETSVDITPARLHFGNIMMKRVELSANAMINGTDLDKSTLEIDRLILKGKALDVDINGKVTGPLSDPYIDAHLATALRLQQLPRELLSKLPVDISGRLDANTGMRLHINDFTPKRFHNIYLDGHMTLSNFNLLSRDSLLAAMAGKAVFDFGTARSVQGGETRIDSMLTMSLKVDTTSVDIPGLKIQSSGLVAGLGTSNRSSSIDTTAINPFGGVIRFKSLILDQPQDTLTLRLRDVETHASLSRYEGIERDPLMRFDLKARRIGTRMPGFALAISQPLISIDAYITPVQHSTDSIKKNSQRRRRYHNGQINRDSTAAAPEVIDWGVSNDLKTLLRRWNVKGTVKSNQAFIFTSSFPLRQRASDIDLTFNTDSICLNNLTYRIGNTHFDVKGNITNIERALSSRTGRAKLRIDFDIDAPFIDVNQLATTTFYETTGNAGPDPDYDEEIEFRQTDTTGAIDSAATRPVLIPRNIEANLSVKADSILYSDLLMHSFSGEVLVNNSAINLHDLHASTDIGSASMSALYWAPDTAHMQFGLGMKLDRFYIDRVLSLIPAVDSLLPALQGFAGVINADLAATTAITPSMDIDLSSFKGSLKLDGDSLVLLDADTFKMLAKWLVFKNKKRNMIDNMTVEIMVDDSQVEIFPFIFDIDRYKLGVMGRNDLNMNLDYHVSVLKSPLPFKFGINIKGNIDDPKIRLGGAKIKPGQATTYAIADTTRINLLGQIEDVFRRGSMSRESMRLKSNSIPKPIELNDTTLSANDSLLMQREGFLPPDTVAVTDTVIVKKKRFPWNR